jgi:demethylmenaquinone methyltransferase / 2-methoxy-6-polyprenyl-1,4-benzoquinol methylase
MKSSYRSVATAVLGIVAALTAIALAPASTPTAASDRSAPQGSGRFFDGVAPRYDLLNRAISLGLDQSWRRAAAAAAAPDGAPPAALALDVATGTGDLAIILAAGGAFGDVHAVDPSAEMLSRLRSKAGGAVRAVSGAAEDLPFEDGRFDAVTVAFGVRNFADRELGLREMARVLRLGGRLVVLEASAPSGRGPADVAARFFIRKIMPAMGAIVSGRFSDYSYLSASMSLFPAPEEFTRMLRDAGLHVQSHRRLWPLGVGPDLYVAVKL